MGISQRYVSKELTHFAGRNLCKNEERYDLFINILKKGLLTNLDFKDNPGSKLEVNSVEAISSNRMYSPNVICFSDIPIEDFSIHISKYSGFGLSFKKEFLMGKGACPVFYIPKYSTIENQGINASRAAYFDNMVKEYHRIFAMLIETEDEAKKARIKELNDFFDYYIFSYLKFFDGYNKDDDMENYYMEREWRAFGPMEFTLKDVWRIIIPIQFAESFRNDLPEYKGQLIFID